MKFSIKSNDGLSAAVQIVLIFAAVLLFTNLPGKSFINAGILIIVEASLVYNLYKYRKYQVGNTTWIRLRTYNDLNRRIAMLILGTVILMFGVFGIRYYHGDDIFPMGVIALLGLLLLLNGICFLPRGHMSIRNNQLLVSGLKTKIETDLHQLREIHIYPDRILLIAKSGETSTAGNLLINAKMAGLIQKYIADANPQVELIITDQTEQINRY